VSVAKRRRCCLTLQRNSDGQTTRCHGSHPGDTERLWAQWLRMSKARCSADPFLPPSVWYLLVDRGIIMKGFSSVSSDSQDCTVLARVLSEIVGVRIRYNEPSLKCDYTYGVVVSMMQPECGTSCSSRSPRTLLQFSSLW